MTTLIKSLYLAVETYGADKGKLSGNIEFINQYGEIKVRVGNEQAANIIAILADQLVETAKETATLMTSEVVAQASQVTLEVEL